MYLNLLMSILVHMKADFERKMDYKQSPSEISYSANSIHIEWQALQDCRDKYIVKYRTKEGHDKFEVERTFENRINLFNLKNDTLYEIKIYVEDTSGDESLSFKTEVRTASASAASKLIEKAEIICDKPLIYRLRPLTITSPIHGIYVHNFCKL